jgi:hypothetical protein
LDLTDLFPLDRYEFRLGLRRGDPVTYFASSLDRTAVLAERRHWFREDPAAYLALLPQGEHLVAEAIELFTAWQLLPPAECVAADPLTSLRDLSERLEPDLVFLAPGISGEMEVAAGAVCFPSAWRLADKVGHPMFSVHAPVPGLNVGLGQQIGATLAKIRPGSALLRTNWSLTASPELNQHPDRHLPPLDATARLDSTWLRSERQALLALPKTGGVLFAIRVESETLASIKARAPETAVRFAQILRSIPAPVVAYKGFATAREPLVQQLIA